MNGNEPAFPRPAVFTPECGTLNGEVGMTKREYFAAMAMQGMAAGNTWCDNFGTTEPEWLKAATEVAVAAADALIAELNRNKAEEPKQ